MNDREAFNPRQEGTRQASRSPGIDKTLERAKAFSWALTTG